MGFQFSLTSILAVRQSLKKHEETQLQSLQREVTRTTGELQSVMEAIARARWEWQKALLKPTVGANLTSMLLVEQQLSAREMHLRRTLDELSFRRDQQMLRYQRADRDHEVLHDLYNQRLAEYQRQESRAQQKLLDDLYSTRRHRACGASESAADQSLKHSTSA